MKKNWKTNTAGILTLLAAAAYIGKKVVSGQALTQEDIGALLGAISGVGLLMAKDNNK